MVKVFTFIVFASLMSPLYGLRIYNQTSNKLITLTNFDFSDCHLQRGSKHIFGCNVPHDLAPGEGYTPTQNGVVIPEFIKNINLKVRLTQCFLGFAQSTGKDVPDDMLETPTEWLVSGFDVMVDDEKYPVTVIDNKFTPNDDNCIIVISDGLFGAIEITKNYNQ